MFNLFNSVFIIAVLLQSLISTESVDNPGHIVLTFQEASFKTGSFLEFVFSAGESLQYAFSFWPNSGHPTRATYCDGLVPYWVGAAQLGRAITTG